LMVGKQNPAHKMAARDDGKKNENACLADLTQTVVRRRRGVGRKPDFKEAEESRLQRDRLKGQRGEQKLVIWPSG